MQDNFQRGLAVESHQTAALIAAGEISPSVLNGDLGRVSHHLLFLKFDVLT